MTATTYANLRDNVQSTVFTLLSGDTNVTTLCSHIIDGTPLKLTKERGFPYIVVNTPTARHDNFVIANSKFDQNISLRITVASFKESAVRQVADAVINSLKTNQATTKAANLNWFKINNTSLTPFTLDNGDIAYFYEIDVGYKFTG